MGDDGQPLDHEPIVGRRPSRYVAPVPSSRKTKGAKPQTQTSLAFDRDDDMTSSYNVSTIVNEIRRHLESWRALPNSNDWGVTPATQRLLQHWRHHDFQGPRPFFCQVEAVEAAIWLTEVARGRRQYAHLFRYLEEANRGANPELFRLALKLATGAGKTTVMAMLIAWQAINAARQPNSSLFSKGFLLVAPGITIKDRLRVLLPQTMDNYYRTRDLVPPDLMPRARQGEDRRHQLPRLPAAREARDQQDEQGGLLGWRNEEIDHEGNRGRDARSRLRRSACAEECRRHQRRGPSLLSGEAGDRRGEGPQGRRKEGSRREQRCRASLDFRHRGIEAQSRRAGRL